MIYQGPVTIEEDKREQGTTLNTIIQKQQTMQRRVTILASSMTLSFYITWMPYAIDCILSMSGVEIAHATNVYAILFAKTGTVVNPILYIFLNKDVSIVFFCYYVNVSITKFYFNYSIVLLL